MGLYTIAAPRQELRREGQATPHSASWRRPSGLHRYCFRQGCYGGRIRRVHADGCFRQGRYGGRIRRFTPMAAGQVPRWVHRLGSTVASGRGATVLTAASGRGANGRCVGRVHTHGCFRQGRHGGCIGRAYAHGCLGQRSKFEPSTLPSASAFREASSIKRTVLAPQRRQPWCPQCTWGRGIQRRRNIRRNLHLSKDTVMNLYYQPRTHTRLRKTTGNPHIQSRHYQYWCGVALTGEAGTAHSTRSSIAFRRGESTCRNCVALSFTTSMRRNLTTPGNYQR